MHANTRGCSPGTRGHPGVLCSSRSECRCERWPWSHSSNAGLVQVDKSGKPKEIKLMVLKKGWLAQAQGKILCSLRKVSNLGVFYGLQFDTRCYHVYSPEEAMSTCWDCWWSWEQVWLVWTLRLVTLLSTMLWLEETLRCWSHSSRYQAIILL